MAGGGPAFVPWLRTLKRELGIPASAVGRWRAARAGARLVEVASADICHQTNPRPCTAADFERLFVQAL